MSKGWMMGFLVAAVLGLALVVGWMWMNQSNSDVTIDMPDMHIRD